MFEFKGRIIYSDSGWVVVTVPGSIASYYRRVVERLIWNRLSKPLHGTHVTVINGNFEKRTDHENWRKYNNQEITLKYDGKIENNRDGYYWIAVYDNGELTCVRKSLGLTPMPHFPFHVTFGHSQEERRLSQNHERNA